MNKTLKLTSIAMMTALTIVTNLFTINITTNNAISFTITICVLTGIYFGPLAAGIVGFTGDLVAHLIAPYGAYNLYIAISCTLFGVISGLVYKMRVHKLIKLAITLVLCFVICTCTLNTFGLWLQWVVGKEPGIIGLFEYFAMDKGGIKKSFWVYLGGRLPFMSINLAVNAAILAILQQTKALDRLFSVIQTKISAKTTEENVADDIAEQ